MSTRRGFLVGTAQLGALALAAPSAIFAAPAQEKPIVLLGSGNRGEHAFFASFNSQLQLSGSGALKPLSLSPAQFKAPGQLQTLLASQRGSMVIGFLDACSELIVSQLIRNLGGAIWIQGEHAADATGLSRHHFLSTPSSAGIGSAMAGCLDQGCSPYSVSVRQLGRVDDSPAATAPHVASQWTTALGTHYADIATRRWRPRNDGAGYATDTTGSRTYQRWASTFIAVL